MAAGEFREGGLFGDVMMLLLVDHPPPIFINISDLLYEFHLNLY